MNDNTNNGKADRLLTLAEIERQTSASRGTVYRWRTKLGLPQVRIPDANAWNCVVFYEACSELGDEELCLLTRFQVLLAEAFVRRLLQQPGAWQN